MVSIITLMPLIPESGANIGNETVDFEGTFCHEAELKTITFPPSISGLPAEEGTVSDEVQMTSAIRIPTCHCLAHATHQY